jgi:hypothetical protein
MVSDKTFIVTKRSWNEAKTPASEIIHYASGVVGMTRATIMTKTAADVGTKPPTSNM